MASDALMQPEPRTLSHVAGAGLDRFMRTRFPGGGIWTFWGYQAGAWQRDAGFASIICCWSPIAADQFLGAGVDQRHIAAAKTSSTRPPGSASARLAVFRLGSGVHSDARIPGKIPKSGVYCCVMASSAS